MSKSLKISESKSKKQIEKIIFKIINDDFAWGLYGDFNVLMMRKNGYINATKLCTDAETKNGKRKELKHWKKNATSIELIDKLSSSVEISTDELFIVKTGGQITEIRGTYVHPKLIPHIASWASPKFAIKVSDIVNEYYVKKSVRKLKKDVKERDDKIDELLILNKKMDKRIKRLLSRNEDLYDKNDEILDKINNISNDRVISTASSLNNHILVIIKNNDNPEEYDEDDLIYEYHALRVMNKSYNSRILDHQNRHPNMEIILKINYSPNSMNLWIRVKDKLSTGRRKKIECDNNKFNLTRRCSENELIEYIKEIHNERFEY